jgi:putative regulatory protein, FmdB family
MATYEFHCRRCNERTTKIHPLSEPLAYPPCPTCGEQMLRVYNFGSVTFKGSGFYRNDK